VTVTATRLRRGRTAAFIQTDIHSDAGLGYRATFVFMSDQPSKIDLEGGLVSPCRSPAADATALHVGPDGFFTGNFNFFDLKAEPRATRMAASGWCATAAGSIRWSR